MPFVPAQCDCPTHITKIVPVSFVTAKKCIFVSHHSSLTPSDLVLLKSIRLLREKSFNFCRFSLLENALYLV